MSELEHGTVKAYRQHLADGSEPCEACRKANANHVRELRRQDKYGSYAQQRKRSAARARALVRLGRRYPEELEELLRLEMSWDAALETLQTDGQGNDE